MRSREGPCEPTTEQLSIRFLETEKIFTDRNSHPLPPPTYRVLPPEQLEALFFANSETSARQVGNANISTATFQAYKDENEDRVFVHEFAKGTVFGILDGHSGSQISEHASRILPLMLEKAISEAMESWDHSTDLSTRRAFLSNVFKGTFADYDSSIMKPVMQIFKLKPWQDWTEDEIKKVYWDGDGAPESRELARRAGRGATALVGFLTKEGGHLTVANLGDSQAFTGTRNYAQDDTRSIYSRQITTEHNGSNSIEVARVEAEHPGEISLFSKFGRLLKIIAVTRAFGDFFFKLDPVFCRRILAEAHHCPVPIPMLEEWPRTHNTPPYISNIPDVTHHSLSKGDIVVFASDGLGDASQLGAFAKHEKASLFVELTAGQPKEVWSEKLGHDLMVKKDEGNTAVRLMKNVLFGTDQRKMARELALEIPPEATYPFVQDDISVICVEFGMM
ncbi:pyruvate dehydrogenase phosphatase, partial [Phenoliferia sp. Uapishka_3]